MKMLKFPWSDDEHTAADGPYNRLLRARKWIYFLASFSLVHSYGGIKYEAIAKASADILHLPTWLATNALIGGLAVLVIQYTLLLMQGWASYKSILAGRFTPSQERTTIVTNIANYKSKIASLDDLLARVELAHESAALAGQEPREDLHQNELKKVRQENAELIRQVKKLEEHDLPIARKNDPTLKWSFYLSEYGIDALRTLAPLILGSSALWQIVALHPGH